MLVLVAVLARLLTKLVVRISELLVLRLKVAFAQFQLLLQVLLFQAEFKAFLVKLGGLLLPARLKLLQLLAFGFEFSVGVVLLCLEPLRLFPHFSLHFFAVDPRPLVKPLLVPFDLRL
jgi:hypothetical protein